MPAPIAIDLRPGRPAKPELLAPRFVPRRRISKGKTERVALLHAIAHIELNAIDLSLDIAVRYTDYGLPFDFCAGLAFWLPVMKPAISPCCITALRGWAVSIAPCLPMTGCGKRR